LISKLPPAPMAPAARFERLLILAVGLTVANAAPTDDTCSSCADCLDACAARRDRTSSEHALLQRKVAVSEFRDDLQEASEGPISVGAAPPAPKIDTYVVNLESRRDRCSCMATQLANAPQAVYRQEALEAHNCPDLKDDKKTMYGHRNHTREKSLFCSNYQIWQRALKSDADFVLVMEDDVLLDSSFWSAVHDLVQNCPHFDYVSVDSWKEHGDLDLDFADVCSQDGFTSLYRPTHKLTYWGTQVQIIRGSFLQTLVSRADLHGGGPMDIWWMMNLNEGRAFAWKPGIALQPYQSEDGISASGCSEDILRSDIGEAEPRFFQLGSVQHRAAANLPRLHCT